MTKVIYYTTFKESPPLNFIESLTVSQKRKVARIMTYIKQYGLITAIRHIKKLAGTPFWEIRLLGEDKIRILYVIEDQDAIVILHGFIKKTQKTPIREIEIALQRLAEWRKTRNTA